MPWLRGWPRRAEETTKATAEETTKAMAKATAKEKSKEMTQATAKGANNFGGRLLLSHKHSTSHVTPS
jgi:hypothetical protein